MSKEKGNGAFILNTNLMQIQLYSTSYVLAVLLPTTTMPYALIIGVATISATATTTSSSTALLAGAWGHTIVVTALCPIGLAFMILTKLIYTRVLTARRLPSIVLKAGTSRCACIGGTPRCACCCCRYELDACGAICCCCGRRECILEG